MHQHIYTVPLSPAPAFGPICWILDYLGQFVDSESVRTFWIYSGFLWIESQIGSQIHVRLLMDSCQMVVIRCGFISDGGRSQ
jgi:hypothetical protein